uniref:Uncharacterized protein n=1 Tax=Manihot esculenta TaxID=3983 RepID=A0A2C9W920_MANES
MDLIYSSCQQYIYISVILLQPLIKSKWCIAEPYNCTVCHLCYNMAMTIINCIFRY